MSILSCVSSLSRGFLQRSTHSVVKFMVNVKLVENNLKSKVGRVIELNVTTQYRIAGTSRARRRTRTARRPSHERDGLPSWAVANAEGRGDAELEAVLRRELEPVEPVGASA